MLIFQMQCITAKKRMLLFKISALLTVFLLIFMLSGCSGNKEEKEVSQIKQTAQKYFDALKVNNQDGVYDCYLPSERDKMEAEYGILGIAGKLIFKVDLGELLSNLNTLFGPESGFENYKYRAVDAVVDHEWNEATAYVEVYELNNDYRGCVQISMTEYDGKWYVLKGSIADSDHPRVDMTPPSNSSQSGKVWIVIIIAAGAIIISAIVILFLKKANFKKKANAPYLDPIIGVADTGDFFCPYCTSSNPIGVRTCIVCGKKLKNKRK